MIKEFEPSLHVYYIPNRCTPDRIKLIDKDYAREQFSILESDKVLFNLAMLFPYKGHQYLIRAMKNY